MLKLKLLLALGLGLGLGWGAALWQAGRLPVTGPDPVGDGAAAAPDIDDFRASLAALPPARRQQLLADAGAFGVFAERRLQQEVLVRAATAAGLDADAEVAAAMRDAAARVLAARYLEREAPVATLAEPADAEVEAFYAARQRQFAVPDRLPVWQIFIAAPVTDPDARAAARTRARQALETLLAGKSGFAELASRESEHEPSRANGGYMGLLAPEELKPEIRQVLLSAPQGKPVGPIDTDAGVHLVQRGALVPGRLAPLDEVRPRIVQALREQALGERQNDTIRAASAAHPLTVEAAQLEAWRQQLLAEEQAAAAPAAAKNNVQSGAD